MAQSLMQIVQTFPQLADSTDVMQTALLTLGIQNTDEVLEQLDTIQKESKGDVNVQLAKALREFKKVVKNGNMSRV
jgi:hypothetical protein